MLKFGLADTMTNAELKKAGVAPENYEKERLKAKEELQRIIAKKVAEKLKEGRREPERL